MFAVDAWNVLDDLKELMWGATEDHNSGIASSHLWDAST